MQSRRDLAVQQLLEGDAKRSGERRKSAKIRTRYRVLPVGDRGLVDADQRGQLLLAQLAGLTKLRDASMDRSSELPALGGSSACHVDKLERRSGPVNNEENTVLPAYLQPSEHMGIAAHKKSPPDEPKELVTPEFRRVVREVLKANAVDNELRGVTKGDPEYRISSHAELAEAIKGDKATGDQQQLSGVIGPAKVELEDVPPDFDYVERSYLVGRIRKALGIKEPTAEAIEVPRARVDAVRQLLALSASDFAAIAKSIAKRST